MAHEMDKRLFETNSLPQMELQPRNRRPGTQKTLKYDFTLLQMETALLSAAGGSDEPTSLVYFFAYPSNEDDDCIFVRCLVFCQSKLSNLPSDCLHLLMFLFVSLARYFESGYHRGSFRSIIMPYLCEKLERIWGDFICKPVFNFKDVTLKIKKAVPAESGIFDIAFSSEFFQDLLLDWLLRWFENIDDKISENLISIQKSNQNWSLFFFFFL